MPLVELSYATYQLPQGVFVSPRFVAASTLPGVSLDYDPVAKTKIGGGTPTDNTAALAAFFATGTAQKPVCLVLDGNSMTSGLFLPATPYVSIFGFGTGFYTKAGANTTPFGNKHGAPFERQTGAPMPSGFMKLQGITIDGAGSANSTTGNPRGYLTPPPSSGPGSDNFAYNWFAPTTNLYVNIDLENLASVSIVDCKSYNSPLYALRIANSNNVLVQGSTFDTTNNTYGQGDGIHVSGPSNNGRIIGCIINTPSDDGGAFNCPEALGGPISNWVVSDCIIIASSLWRVYAGNNTAVNLRMTNTVGIATQGAGYILGVQPGTATGAGGLNIVTDQIQDFASTHSKIFLGASVKSYFQLCNSIGECVQEDHIWDTPQNPIPWIGLSNTGLNIGHFAARRWTLQRTANGHALAGAILDTTANLGFGSSTATFRRFDLSGYKVTDQGTASYGNIPWLFKVGTGSSIGLLWIEDLDPTNIAALVDPTYGFTNIVKVGGPGVASCGFQVPDSVMLPNTLYISATGANAGKLCIQHTAGTVVALG